MVAPPASREPNLGLLAINRTFKQFGEHPATTFGTAALMCVPLAFLGILSALNPGPATMGAELVIGSIFSVWVSYAITVAVGMYAEGRDPHVAGLLRRSFSFGLIRYGLTSLLVSLVVGLIALVALIPFFMSLASIDIGSIRNLRLSERDIFRLGSGMLLSLPLLLAALLFTYLKWGLSQTASALEDTGPVGGMRRSWQVTKGRVWQFFVLAFVTAVISMAVSIFVSGPAAMVSIRPTAPAPDNPFSAEFFKDQIFGQPLGPAQAVITGISAYLSAVLLSPLSAATLANFFLLARKPPELYDPRNLLVPITGPEVPVPAALPAVEVAPAALPQEPDAKENPERT